MAVIVLILKLEQTPPITIVPRKITDNMISRLIFPVGIASSIACMTRKGPVNAAILAIKMINKLK